MIPMILTRVCLHEILQLTLRILYAHERYVTSADSYGTLREAITVYHQILHDLGTFRL